MEKSKILNLAILGIVGTATLLLQPFSLANNNLEKTTAIQKKENAIISELFEEREKITSIQKQIKPTISDFFRKNGVNNKTKDFITTVFQKCETSAKDPILKKTCKEINFNFLGTIKTSFIDLKVLRKKFEDKKELKQYYFYGGPNPEDFVCSNTSIFFDGKTIKRGGCPMKSSLKYSNGGTNVWYTMGDYILGISAKKISERGYYHNNKYTFEGIVVAKNKDTHRQPAFQMKEIGNGIEKGNDTVYIKNKNGKMVIGVMEDYGKTVHVAIFREFTLQDNNSWKLTQCAKRKILSPNIDGGDELVFGFEEFYQDDDNKKMLPTYETEILPLAKCGNEVEITTVLE